VSKRSNRSVPARWGGRLPERIETVIIGGGQAGLALSYWLTGAGHEHVILERGRVGERWRSERWDSFTVLTPNWAITLPGHPYEGDDPDGFMGKDELVAFLADYAAMFRAPVRTGVEVSRLREAAPDGRFVVHTDSGQIAARNVVVATGPFQEPRIPGWSGDLPADIAQLHSREYRNPAQLERGAVLVVGAGSSGQQIAEELLAAGRRVFLSVGRYRPAHRMYRGYDWTWWQNRVGYFDRIVDENYVEPPAIAQTGARGGHELNLRQMALDGLTLLGHARGAANGTLYAAPDLADTMRQADEHLKTFEGWFDEWTEREGIDALPKPPPPLLPDPAEMSEPITELDLAAAGIRTVVWATGFRSSLDWIELPITDATGKLRQYRGVSEIPGLYFLGLRRLYKVKSSFMLGVGDDAAYLAEQIVEGRRP